MALFTGCGKRADLPTWQRTVERHVTDTGGGDPAALRDLTLADGRPGFAIFSGDRPDQSTDAVGVLLGHPQVGQRLWVVYLFGLVKKQTVDEIRLAAMEVGENGNYEWQVGKLDRKALQAYRDHNRRLAEQRFPGRENPPAEYLGFPQLGDRFEMHVEGSTIRAVHEPSGATWRLTVK